MWRHASRRSARRAPCREQLPVDKGSYSYPVFWNACKLLTKARAVQKRPICFAQTAMRVPIGVDMSRLTATACPTRADLGQVGASWHVAGVVAGLVPVTPTIFCSALPSTLPVRQVHPSERPLGRMSAAAASGQVADIESRSSHISVQTSRPCRDRSCSSRVLKAVAPRLPTATACT